MTFKLNASHVLTYASASDLTRCGPNVTSPKASFISVTYAPLDGKVRQISHDCLKILYSILLFKLL